MEHRILPIEGRVPYRITGTRKVGTDEHEDIGEGFHIMDGTMAFAV